MDLLAYTLFYMSMLAFAIFALYSRHRNLMAVAGVGFVILGVLILASPIEYISGEVINYAP